MSTPNADDFFGPASGAAAARTSEPNPDDYFGAVKPPEPKKLGALERAGAAVKEWATRERPAGPGMGAAGGLADLMPSRAPAAPAAAPAPTPENTYQGRGVGGVLGDIRANEAARAQRIAPPNLDRPAGMAPAVPQGLSQAEMFEGSMTPERVDQMRRQAAYLDRSNSPTMQPAPLEERIAQGVRDFTDNPVARGAVAGFSQLGQTGVGAVRGAADLVGADGVADFARGASGIASTIGQGATQDLGGNSKLAADVTSSILNSAPALAIGTIGGPALRTLFAQSAAADYAETGNAAHAGIMGAAEALGERFGLPEQVKLLKGVMKGMPPGEVARVFGALFAKEIPGEQLTAAIQFMADKFGPGARNPNATLADYLEQAGETLKLTIAQTAVMGGGPAALVQTRNAQQQGDAAIERSATPMAQRAADAAGFIRPTERRKQAFDRLDDYAAEYAMPPNLVAKIKERTEGVPLAELPGKIKRAVQALSQVGVYRGPVDDGVLGMLDEPAGGTIAAATPPGGTSPSASADPSQSTPQGYQSEDGGVATDTTDYSGLSDPAEAAALLDDPAAQAEPAPAAEQPEWAAFPPETGTKGIPRADMPQIKSIHRGAMTNFLNARGITHEQQEIPAADLKPTQAEYSPSKVAQAKGYTDTDRSILVSSDGYILDGHHQALAKMEKGEPVKAIVLNAPMDDLLPIVKQFPSATQAEGATEATNAQSDVPVSPGVAAAAGDRRAPDADRSVGTVGPLAIDPRGGMAGAAEDPAPSGASAAPVGSGNRPDEALTPAAPRLIANAGRTPNATEPLTLHANPDGTLTPHLGAQPLVDYDSGEPIVLAAGTTDMDAKKAIRAAGAVSKKVNFFPATKGADAQPVQAAQPEAAAVEAPAPARSDDATAEGLPAAGTAGVQADGLKKPPKAKKVHPLSGSSALGAISAQLKGISPDLLSDLTGKVTRTRTGKTGKKTQYSAWDNPLHHGHGPLFRAGGTGDLSEIARVLEEEGFIEAGLGERDPLAASQRAEKIVRAELSNGGSTVRIGSAEAIEDEMNRRRDMAMDDDGIPDDLLGQMDDSDLAESGYAAASEDVKAATELLMAEAEAAGIDTEGLKEDAARGIEDQSEDFYHARLQDLARKALAEARSSAAQADTSAARGSGEDRGEVDGGQGEESGLTLAAQSAADLKTKTQREARADELDQRQQIDAERDMFGLQQQSAPETRKDTTGDIFGGPSAADLQAAAERERAKKAKGQTGPDLFSAPADAEAQKDEAPKPSKPTEAKPDRLTDAGEELIRNRRGKLKGLAWDDVSSMNDTLKVAQVVKGNVWPRPDYAKMVEDGAPAWKAAMLKAVYDKIATAPVTRAAPTDEDLKAYIETLHQVRDTLTAELDRAEKIGGDKDLWKTLKSANVFSKVFPIPADAKPVYGAPSPFDRMSAQGKENNRRALLIGGNGAIQALQFNYKVTSRVADLLKEGFPAKMEAWQKSYEVRPLETRDSDVPEAERTGAPQQRFYVYQKDSTWRLAKGGQDGGYATQEQAEAFAKSLLARKKEPLPPSRGLDLAEATRTGPDWRDGKDVTAEQVMAKFGFRGVNLGEYVKAKQGMAQLHLNHVYDAFSDLADLLGVPPKAMSLGGTLGVAVGAQGSGKALAHFVPGVNEINITRDSGAGALAHEFGHAMDHYFSTQHGRAASMAKRPYLSAVVEGVRDDGGVRPEVMAAMRAVMKTINARSMTEAEARQYIADQRALNQKRLDRWVKEFAGNKGADTAALSAVAEKLRRGDLGAPQDADVETNLSEFMRAAGLKPGNSIAANAFTLAYRLRDLADEARFMKSHIPQVDTDYAKASAAMDAKKQGDGYWSTPWEKFARAFETFAMDALKDRQRESLYLSGLVDSAGWAAWSAETGKAIPYPAGDERLAMQQAFQKLVDTIQTKETDAGPLMFSPAGWGSIDGGGSQADTARYAADPDPKHLRIVDFARDSIAAGRPGFMLRAVAPPRDRSDLRAARAIARGIAGHTAIFVKQDGGRVFNGAAFGSHGHDYVLIDVDSSRPTMAVLGHEILHRLRAARPDLYDRLNDRIGALLTNESVYAGKLNARYDEMKLPRLSEGAIREELLADVFGDEWNDPTFWRELGQGQPSGFKAIVDAVMKYLDDLIQLIAKKRPFGTDEYLSDLKAARVAVIEATREFSAGEVGTDPDPASIKFSLANKKLADWQTPAPSRLDDFTYKFQDKQVDLKRTVEAIKAERAGIEDKWDAYLQEELFHGRAAKRTQDFVAHELDPLLREMKLRALTIEDVDQYLHARHAEEANALIAERNRKDNDGQQGIDGATEESPLQDGGSGMTNAEAQAYFAALDQAQKKRLEAVAAKVDAILAKTREMYASYGLESKETVDAWAKMFDHYVPLMREDHDGGMGIGQGFSIKGRESKHRTGSTTKVIDILANIALQRERAIVRGEKNRVSVALAGLVKANPAPEFWSFDKVPTERVLNEATGKVEEREDRMFKSRPNVMVAKIPDASGKVHERAIVFNERNERAMRMVTALKNLDAAQLEGVLGVSAKITRYFAAVNTQYNPVFGVVNLVRDVQSAAINLSSTALADKKAEVLKHVIPALRGTYADARAVRADKAPSSDWAKLWEEFQNEGGATGFRDLFRTSNDRAEAIQRSLDPTKWMNSPLGQVFTAGGVLKVPMAIAQTKAGWMFDWLSDYNLAMENAVRLSAYKVGLESGMTKQRAASLAKNLTVNFNRKGQVGQQAGAMYAFFNASMQGTARMAQVLFDTKDGKGLSLTKVGKRIIAGGITLGAVQALLLAAVGYGDDDPPEFVRERNIIIPIGGGKYLTVPMPLGWHVLPNIGRITTEFAMGGFKEPGKRVAGLAAIFADSFNPIGNAGLSLQTIAPTPLDPLVALAENRDWTGKPIARESFNKATPGHQLAKDTASTPAKMIAEAINWLSGGTQYKAGAMSPTPDQIDYLWGQVTGGVGRELGKAEQSIIATISGEDLPPHKVPLLGRFYGDANSSSSQATRFYENLNRLNEHEAEIKGLSKNEGRAAAREYMRDNPEAQLFGAANAYERQVQALRAQKRDMLKKEAPRAEVKKIEDRITELMKSLNFAVEKQRAKEPA